MKLDPASEEARALIADYWCCTADKLFGKALYDSKVFK